MTKNEINKLVQETTNELVSKNPNAFELDCSLEIEASCLVTLKVLQKLGIVDKFTD